MRLDKSNLTVLIQDTEGVTLGLEDDTDGLRTMPLSALEKKTKRKAHTRAVPDHAIRNYQQHSCQNRLQQPHEDPSRKQKPKSNLFERQLADRFGAHTSCIDISDRNVTMLSVTDTTKPVSSIF